VSKVELPAFFDLKNAYASSSFYAVPALYTRTPKGGFFAAERIITREEARQLSAKLPAYAYIYYPPKPVMHKRSLHRRFSMQANRCFLLSRIRGRFSFIGAR
jgi:hypothetical protein